MIPYLTPIQYIQIRDRSFTTSGELTLFILDSSMSSKLLFIEVQ